MSLEVAVQADASADDAFQDFSGHAPETDLEIVFLHLHVDKYGGKGVDCDGHIGVVFFSEPNQTFENLLFGLEHSVDLFRGEVDAVIAVIDVRVHHIGGTEEMEDVGMRLRFVSQHIERVFK